MTDSANGPGTDNGQRRKPSRRLWASSAVALVVLLAVVLLVTRQRPVTAASVVANAVSSLDKISSYHIKYKNTILQPNGQESVAFYEYWYQAPSDWKLVLSQTGSKMTQVLAYGTKWIYSEGSGVALEAPVSDKVLQANADSLVLSGSPKDIIRDLGDGYRYVGTEDVGGRKCEVIEGGSPDGLHRKVCVDSATGLLLQDSQTKQGKLFLKMEMVAIEVNEPMPKGTFDPKLPPETFVIKSPEFGQGLFQLDADQWPQEPR